MKKPHNERKSKKKSKILLTTVGNEIVLSFSFLSLFVLFLNVLTPLMSLFFFYFPYFYDLGGTKTNCQGWERKKERRKFGVGAISLIPLRPLWWQSRACTAWRWRRFESEGVKAFLTLVLSTYLVMDVSDRGLGLEKWPVDVEGARG